MKHPEQREGELYIGNVSVGDFHRCAWNTKRMGSVALYADGRAVEGFAEFKPMFILASEIEGKIKSEEDAQGPNWTEKVRTYRAMLEECA